MTLTNGEIYCKTVYLARGATADGWREVTDEEAAAAMTEVDPEEALEELMEALDET